MVMKEDVGGNILLCRALSAHDQGEPRPAVARSEGRGRVLEVVEVDGG